MVAFGLLKSTLTLFWAIKEAENNKKNRNNFFIIYLFNVKTNLGL